VRLFRAFAGVFVLVLVATGAAWAQAVAGSQLSGVVRDSTGGTIPGAEVTVTKTDTGLTRTVFTGADGSYTLPNLPVGPYELKVVLQGFNTFVRSGIILQVGSNPEVNVTLSVGAISEQVTVTANTSLVETKNTGVGQVIDNQRVMELPLNGRQATELIFLSGLATSAPAGDLNTNKNFPTATISVAGGQANGITYIMDGGTHNDPFNNLNLPTPFPDALQEFKVETSSLPARYGHHAASAVNLVTKSGTNQFHGDAFDFIRNYHLNARNFFSPTRDSLRRNQFGGTLGGPIVKDRTHFFANYEDTKIDDVSVVTSVLAPGSFPAPQTQKQGFFKLNHRFTDRNLLEARYSFNRNKQEGQSVGGLSTYDRRSNTDTASLLSSTSNGRSPVLPSQWSRSAVRGMASSAPNLVAWVKARPASAWPEMPVGKPR